MTKTNELTVNKDEALLEETVLLFKEFPDIFSKASFLAALFNMNDDIQYCEKLLDALKDDLPEIINSEENYNDVLSSCGDLQSSKREAVSKKIQQIMSDKELEDLRGALNLASTSAFDLYLKRARDDKENASSYDCPPSEKSKYNNNPTP